MPIEIAELVVYPIKSLRGVSLPSAEVEKRGLKHDRRWMLVDGEGEFLTQRRLSRMALIDTRILLDEFEVAAAGLGSVRIPIEPQGPHRTVTVWNDTCEALEACRVANEWFSNALELDCALVHMPESTQRPGVIEGDLVAFSDNSPILVAGRASIDDLNNKLASPIPIRRFRPNVVLAGSLPYEEDDWSVIEAGPVALHKVMKSGRCLVTTIDIETGLTSDEPLRTLATYRKEGSHVWFGCYYAPDSLGVISVGDRVAVR
jgi:uncharacterized protein